MFAEGAHLEGESGEASFCHSGRGATLGLQKSRRAAGAQQIGPRQQQVSCVAEAMDPPGCLDGAAFTDQLFQCKDLIGMAGRAKAVAGLQSRSASINGGLHGQFQLLSLIHI